ncbi:hypothetical protein JXJ21_05900 [candidate division KSB1 bacterium]|nr:hypothetical protein [candidate division KSB1 bacterium]
MSENHPHILTLFIISISASFWAIFSAKFLMPVAWLVFLFILLFFSHSQGHRRFLYQVARIAILLLFVSLIQVIFRREGDVLLAVDSFPLIFSEGAREAVLLWIRFMIIFEMAQLFALVSGFEFLSFCNSVGLSLNLSMLLLVTFQLMPRVWAEAKRAWWFLRFRGLSFGSLPFKQKVVALRQLVFAILMRSIQYIPHASLALELRGYGHAECGKLQQPYPFRMKDFILTGLAVGVNLAGLIY